ncbi:MAG: hypothetical protein LC754_11385 [Acidobacteria bacterium]|nr:hypothetical protein [Acidobacteriota bacterium]
MKMQKSLDSYDKMRRTEDTVHQPGLFQKAGSARVKSDGVHEIGCPSAKRNDRAGDVLRQTIKALEKLDGPATVSY